jgi:Family of unknown function (DUF5994)
MTSGSVTEPRSSGPRLQLKPAVSTTAYVDGGWWPRSRVLTAELPGLIGELSAQLGPIAVVGYHLNAWDEAPDSVELDQHTVLLQGFTADPPHSVIVIGASGRRLTLLVVSPDSSDALAHELLTGAARPEEEVSAAHPAAGNQSLASVTSRIIELEGVIDAATKSRVSAWVEQAAAQFVGAPVQGFVPILVEHMVRSRIAADPHRNV